MSSVYAYSADLGRIARERSSSIDLDSLTTEPSICAIKIRIASKLTHSQFATPAFEEVPVPYQSTASANVSNLTSRYCVPRIFRKFRAGSDMLILQYMGKGTYSFDAVLYER